MRYADPLQISNGGGGKSVRGGGLRISNPKNQHNTLVSKETNTLFSKFGIEVPQSGFDQLRYILSICLYESKDAAAVEVNASRALKNLSGTAAKGGRAKQPGLIDYEKKRQGLSKLDCTALANEVQGFISWYRRTFPDRALPLGVPELNTAWAEWRGRTAAKPKPEPAPAPEVPDDISLPVVYQPRIIVA